LNALIKASDVTKSKVPTGKFFINQIECSVVVNPDHVMHHNELCHWSICKQFF